MLFGLGFVAGVFIYFYREAIRAKYYKIRWPEKTIKIVIHYHANVYKNFWRIIPLNHVFSIGSQGYFFDPKTMNKRPDIFAKQNKFLEVEIDNIKYKLDSNYYVERKNARFPEIHYLFNNPNPLSFDPVIIAENSKKAKKEYTKEEIQKGLDRQSPSLTSKELKEFEDRDMFGKLLQLKEQKGIIILVMILCLINLLISLAIASKVFDLIKSKGG